MPTRRNTLKQFSPRQWWRLAMLSFWTATLAAGFADFAGERWLGLIWPRGPDLFPNLVLGYPLALFQIVAGLCLVAAGVRLARDRGGPMGAALGAALTLGTATACLAAYTVFEFWFLGFMGRTL